MSQCFYETSPFPFVPSTLAADPGAEIIIPAGPRSVVQSVASSGARYQQYVQQVSDSSDTLNAIISAQRGWMAAVIDTQKSTLDLCHRLMSSEQGIDFMRRMLDDSAKYVLYNWQVDS